MKSILGSMALIAVIAYSHSAHALSEKAIYARCYAQLTGLPVPTNSSVMASIKAGKTKAVDACIALLNKGKLASNGALAVNDTESVRVLNNFYQFHRTWFPTANQDQISGYQNEFDSNTNDFIEMSTPALTLTRALFSDLLYSNVLRGTVKYAPIRGTPGTFALAQTDAAGNVSSTAVVPAPYSGTGLISGIVPGASALILANYSIPNLGLASQMSGQTGIDLHRALGGGILGQQGYFLLNVGHSKGQVFDGALKLPRKWAKTTLENMLCFTLPALRESDIQAYISSSTDVQFRRAGSCITCHASMDQFASTARNWVVAETANGNVQKSIMVGNFTVGSTVAHNWSATAVPGYHRQNPTGKLMIRSYYNGNLINRDVANVEEMGARLTELQEYYQCAAKKYFRYFTGIDVSLYDRTDPANAPLNKALTERDVEDRKFVETLGKELSQTQSLSKLIESILRSNYYNKAAFDPRGNE
ncbi:hypothetical protein [Bdellovibrio sp. HCB274]|uniref:hypothetical protein n=1 Tax=Bdellovibrio sp. HCB274 TaxID=3394361 RepID=UPI0039B5395D